MWIIIKAVCLILLLLIVPFLCGTIITRFLKKEKESIIQCWVFGFIFVLAVAELLVVPATFLRLSFGIVQGAYYVLLAAASLVGAVSNRKRIVGMWTEGIKKIPHTPLVVWLLLLLIAGQMFVYGFYMHEDSDDAFYVATAVTALEENSLFRVDPQTGQDYGGLPSRYVLSPFPIFHAMASSLVSLHPTIAAHTVLPTVYLLLTYGVFALLGQKLFRGSKEKAGWMVLLAAMHLCYAGYSTSTQGSMMLLRIWQGKALLASALLPMVFYMFLRFLKERETMMDYILMTCVMLACCLVSSMGIITGAILFGCCGMVAAGMRKDVLLLGKMALCALPNVMLAVLYVLIR